MIVYKQADAAPFAEAPYPTSPLFRELGDPDLLRTLPSRYEFIPEGRGHLKSWLKGGEEYVIADE